MTAKKHNKDKPPRDEFVDAANDSRMRNYLRKVHYWHGFVKFLGFSKTREDVRDLPIVKLFVEPRFSERLISADAWDADLAKKATFDLFEALSRDRRLVVLGGPGSGKSTLTDWLCESFSSPLGNDAKAAMGPLIPIAMVLREMALGTVESWDTLVAAWLKRPVAGNMDAKTIDSLGRSGQGLFLLDGIDEISSVELRQRLRDAVWKAFDRYPSARFVLTSRTVGYEDVCFDREVSATHTGDSQPLPVPANDRQGAVAAESVREATIAGRLLLETDGRDLAVLGDDPKTPRPGQRQVHRRATALYLAPFNDRQRHDFIRNWFAGQEANAQLARTKAEELCRRVAAHEAVDPISRIPSLLTLISLLFRNENDLPNGRAELFAKISEAYLDTIDRMRGLTTRNPFKWQNKECWLAYIAFQMQLMREKQEAAGSFGSGIVVAKQQVLDWLRDCMRRPDTDAYDQDEAEDFLDHIGRRSGLFLPRGEGRYAFAHLSLMEFYAALYLKRGLTDVQWILASFGDVGKVQEKDLSLDKLRERTANPVWHEVFTLLFELLTDNPDQGTRYAEALFQPPTGPGPEGADGARSILVLLAYLSVDAHNGLSTGFRRHAWDRCWDAALTKRTEQGHQQQHDEPLAPILTRPLLLMPHAWERLVEWFQTHSEVTTLDLTDCTEFRETKRLRDLAALQSLRLIGTSVSDITPLTELTALRSLALLSTSVSDITPLAELTALRHLDLYLSDPSVSDITPLAGLTALQSLALVGMPVPDITPLAGLTALQSLDLTGTSVPDITPLAGLTALRSLCLTGTSVSDITPLAGLTALQSLNLRGLSVFDITPLAGLTALQSLDLDGTSVSDITPLAGLTALQSLDLTDTPASQSAEALALLQKLDGLTIVGAEGDSKPASSRTRRRSSSGRRKKKR